MRTCSVQQIIAFSLTVAAGMAFRTRTHVKEQRERGRLRSYRTGKRWVAGELRPAGTHRARAVKLSYNIYYQTPDTSQQNS